MGRGHATEQIVTLDSGSVLAPYIPPASDFAGGIFFFFVGAMRTILTRQ